MEKEIDCYKASPGRPRHFDRQKVLEAALATFWKHGYTQTTMNQLSQAMGIASASIYCAFGSKADLFLEALEYYRRAYWCPIYQRFQEISAIRPAFLTFFEDSARVLLRPGAPCGCLTLLSILTTPAEENKIHSALKKLRSEIKEIFRDKLMAGITLGELDPETRVPELTGALLDFFDGLAFQAQDGLCLAELLAIAVQGVNLIPCDPCG